MKLQFSLATLLVCMTVLAAVCWLSAVVPVTGETLIPGGPVGFGIDIMMPYSRGPQFTDIALRLALWAPPALAATLVILWAIRRLKSRRENGPPVG